MTVGMPPFVHKNRDKLFQKILKAELKFPPWTSEACNDIIKELLVPKPENRLGCRKTGIDEVKNHRWFKEVDFLKIYERKVTAP